MRESLVIFIFLSGAGAAIVLAVVWAVIRTKWKGRPWPRTFRSDDDVSERSSTFLGGPEDIPLHLRRVSLKVCPDCRELVPITESVCKYCGCAQGMPATKADLAAGDRALTLKRRPKKEPDSK
jgi:hypothetical protein